MSDGTAEFDRLSAMLKAMETPAKRLALSLGNFHGMNDFADSGPTRDNGFVLSELQRDLIEMTVLRTYALLAPLKFQTDASLIGAADMIDDVLRSEILKRADDWTYPNAAAAAIRKQHVSEDLGEFDNIVRNLDVGKLRDYRNWVLAHTTLKPTPPLTFIEVWEIAEAALRAYDKVTRAVFGDDQDVYGLAEARREQSLVFWQNFCEPPD